jgi:DNA-binding transcriptional ArsR family regulator
LRRGHSSNVMLGLLNSAPVFAALGDETRLRLIARLCNEGPAPIKRLAAGFGITRQAITKHLRALEDSGLVRNRRQGRESVWQLDQHRFQEVRRYLGIIEKQWDTALGRLRRIVEE